MELVPSRSTPDSQTATRRRFWACDDELRNAPDCGWRVFPELEGKEEKWLKKSEDSLYQVHLDRLTHDALKPLALEKIIAQLGTDIYGRPEKLVIFTSSPVVSIIRYGMTLSCAF